MCPYAKDSCRKIEPELEPVSPGNNHLSACLLMSDNMLRKDFPNGTEENQNV